MTTGGNPYGNSPGSMGSDNGSQQSELFRTWNRGQPFSWAGQNGIFNKQVPHGYENPNGMIWDQYAPNSQNQGGYVSSADFWSRYGGGGQSGDGGLGILSGLFSGSGAQAGLPKVETTVTPQDVYTPAMTRQATNLGVAQAQSAANPRFAQKQFDRPGVSRSAGSMSAAMPQIMGARSQAAQIPIQQGFTDAATNAQNRLQGETARESEGLGLGSLLARQNALSQQKRSAWGQKAIGLLGGLI